MENPGFLVAGCISMAAMIWPAAKKAFAPGITRSGAPRWRIWATGPATVSVWPAVQCRK